MEKNLEKGWGTSLYGDFLPTNISPLFGLSFARIMDGILDGSMDGNCKLTPYI